jgi:APA family basic amino acid/polyamine antiporter
MNSLPPFKELMYIFGLVWWCYTGFETCVSMGSETKYPQYTLPRALKVSVFLVFAVNAIFQWFLVGLVPLKHYGILAAADAPYAEGLKAAGLIGFPIILLCIGIAFCGDLSTINPGIAAPARYIYTMAEDGALPKWMGKIHHKHKTPHIAVIIVGIINMILIATDSITYIASVSLISLGVCYMIGCLSYLGLKKKYPDLNRPYKAPAGVFGSYFTLAIYAFMLAFADRMALITAGVLSVMCLLFYYIYTKDNVRETVSVEQEIGIIEEPDEKTKILIDSEYKIWKLSTIIVTLIAIAIYIIPLFV